MNDGVNCRGYHTLGTACGICSKCRKLSKQIDTHWFGPVAPLIEEYSVVGIPAMRTEKEGQK